MSRKEITNGSKTGGTKKKKINTKILWFIQNVLWTVYAINSYLQPCSYFCLQNKILEIVTRIFVLFILILQKPHT